MRKLHQVLFLALIILLPVQLGKHFWPEWSYVLGLKIDYLAPTVYLTDLLVVGILGLWVWENARRLRGGHHDPGSSQSLSQERSGIERYLGGGKWLAMALLAYLFITSLFAQNPGAALYKFFKIIEFTLLGLYIAKNILISQYPNVSISLSLAVIYSSLIAIAQFIKQASLGGIFWWLGERTFTSATPGIAKAIISGRLLMRPYATFPHPNVLAGFVLVSLILLQNTSVKKILRWVAIILGLITIAISFSRSVWLVGLLVLLKQLGGGALSLIKLPFSTGEAIFQRLYLIKVASSMIRTAPLAGVGLNNFIVRLPEFWPGPETIRFLQPVHNIFLLVAAETGLVGLAVFLWFLILTYKRLLITNNKQLLLLLSVILTLGLFDHYFLTLQQTQLLFSIVLGLCWPKKR